MVEQMDLLERAATPVWWIAQKQVCGFPAPCCKVGDGHRR